jgi:hypothetical protein
MKTTKTRRFSNKTKTSVGLVSNLDHETKKTRIRKWQIKIKIQQDFIVKKKQNKTMTKKNIPKINVEHTKDNGKFYFYLYL